MRLAGKVALISGAARGMGAVEARLFAQEGAKVVIGDILEAEGRKVEADIRVPGAGARRISIWSKASRAGASFASGSWIESRALLMSATAASPS